MYVISLREFDDGMHVLQISTFDLFGGTVGVNMGIKRVKKSPSSYKCGTSKAVEITGGQRNKLSEL